MGRNIELHLNGCKPQEPNRAAWPRPDQLMHPPSGPPFQHHGARMLILAGRVSSVVWEGAAAHLRPGPGQAMVTGMHMPTLSRPTCPRPTQLKPSFHKWAWSPFPWPCPKTRALSSQSLTWLKYLYLLGLFFCCHGGICHFQQL